MMENDNILKRRFMDLANRAHQRGIITYSDFLSDGDLQIYFRVKSNFDFVNTAMYGGYPDAERQIISFLPCVQPLNELIYPISCLEIAPVHKKFAEDLTHRDYLGAILNLGIERTLLGDILVTEHVAYLFCKSSIASFIIEQCCRIRHTTVVVREVDFTQVSYKKEFEEVSGTVSSLRLDSILTVCTKLSRGKCTELIRSEKVFVNHRLITSPHYTPSDEDIISIRGVGKFIFCQEEARMTKKGRFFIKLMKYK